LALRPALALFVCVVVTLSAGSACSIRRYAINQVGDALAEGPSVYETDEDVELVGEALPFGLKLVESLLVQSPNHRGLLLTASSGFVLYSYAYVDFRGEMIEDEDLDRAQRLRDRARKLYLRAHGYGLRGLELSYPGFRQQIFSDPAAAVQQVVNKLRRLRCCKSPLVPLKTELWWRTRIIAALALQGAVASRHRLVATPRYSARRKASPLCRCQRLP
jgi:hypothetical protein